MSCHIVHQCAYTYSCVYLAGASGQRHHVHVHLALFEEEEINLRFHKRKETMRGKKKECEVNNANVSARWKYQNLDLLRERGDHKRHEEKIQKYILCSTNHSMFIFSLSYHIRDQANEHGGEDQPTEHRDRKHCSLPHVVNPNLKSPCKPHLKYSRVGRRSTLKGNARESKMRRDWACTIGAFFQNDNHNCENKRSTKQKRTTAAWKERHQQRSHLRDRESEIGSAHCSWQGYRTWNIKKMAPHTLAVSSRSSSTSLYWYNTRAYICEKGTRLEKEKRVEM